MIDIQLLRKDIDNVAARLATRKFQLDVAGFNAIEAERKLLRAVRRHNGSGSYLPTQILCNGEPLTLEMLDEATDIRINLEAGR